MIFAMSPSGLVIPWHSFTANDGNLYGTTQEGGINNFGTIFQYTWSGALKTIHSFLFQEGSIPFGGLLQATNGNFCGATTGGGPANSGVVNTFSIGLPPLIKLVPHSGLFQRHLADRSHDHGSQRLGFRPRHHQHHEWSAVQRPVSDNAHHFRLFTQQRAGRHGGDD